MSTVSEPFTAHYPNANEPERRLTLLDHLKLSAFWFGFNVFWGAFLGNLLGEQMKHLAPDHPARYVGYLYTWAAFPPLIVPLIAGPLSDRCTSRLGRRRPFIATGSAIALIGVVLMASALPSRSLPLYFIGYFVVQIGMNIALAAYMGVIPDMVPSNQRGTASAYYAVMTQVGTLLGVASVMVFHTGTRELMVVALIFAVFSMVAMVALPEKPLPKGSVEPVNWVTQGQSLWIDPRKYQDFAWVWLTRALMMLGFYAILPFLNYYLHDVIKSENPAGDAAKVMGLVLIAATISGFVGGVVSDRIGRKKVVIWSSILMAVMSLGFAFVGSLMGVIGAGVIFGLGFGAYTSVDWALGTDVLPNQSEAGKDMSIWHIAMILPQQIGPIIVGAIILEQFKGPKVLIGDVWTATYGKDGYMLLFLFSAIAFFFSGVLVRKVKGST